MNEEKGRPAVFLDRDGTIIVDAHFLDDPERIEILPGAVEGIRALNDAGIPVVIATNQSGVARGYFDEETVTAIHERLLDLLAEREAVVDAVYYCPHLTLGSEIEYRKDCRCRKPGPGMALIASRELGLDLSRSYVVGDKPSDLGFGRNIGGKSILVRTGKGKETERSIDSGEIDAAFDTLSGAAEYIIEDLNKGS